MSKERQQTEETPTDEFLEEETVVESEEPKYTFTSKREYKKHIKGEKARQKAIEKARAKYQPLEEELEYERDRSKRIADGETVEPRKKKTFCERHPKVCKTGKNIGEFATTTAGGVKTVTKKTYDATKKVVSTTAEGVRKFDEKLSEDRGHTFGSVFDDEPTGSRVSSSKVRTSSTKKTKTASTTKGRMPPQRASTTSSKARTTAKRTASTTKGRTTPKKAQKPTQKRTTTKGTAKSTPKKKSPKRPRESDWWGYGDAGL